MAVGKAKAPAHTPAYVVDEDRLEANLEILQGLRRRTGAKILLAQKAFSLYGLYSWMAGYLDGTTASGPYELRLAATEWPGGEHHIFSPAYREEDWPEILSMAGHVVFNSWDQLLRFGPSAKEAGREVGLRVNPACSTQEGHAIYDPCAPGSRLGATWERWQALREADGRAFAQGLSLLDGLHFHTLCQQDAPDLAFTLEAVERQFGAYLKDMRWINFGGGHHITRPDYTMDVLEACIGRMQENYGLEVYLEPGEAVALDAGYLYSTVLEIVENQKKIAILDTSAACHMPDVLEMPYRPPLTGGGEAGGEHSYILAGPTCLAGDVIGEYSFDRPLEIGDVLEFGDMAIYSMVKNNTFNGMPLPWIYLRRRGADRLWKSFGYEEFRRRL